MAYLSHSLIKYGVPIDKPVCQWVSLDPRYYRGCLSILPEATDQELSNHYFCLVCTKS